MIFNFGSYTIDVDVEKTKKVYSELMTVSQNCNCDGCRNFEKYIDILPKAIISFFDTLGVDLRKVAECCVYCKNDDGTLLYGGFCLICGALIQGESAYSVVT